jgi:hypothetical protein
MDEFTKLLNDNNLEELEKRSRDKARSKDRTPHFGARASSRGRQIAVIAG